MIFNGTLDLKNCNNLISLGNLTEVGMFDIESNKKLKSLSKLKIINGTFFSSKYLNDLGDLEYVGGNFYLADNRNIKTIIKLKKVKGTFYCPVNLEDLGNLEYVGKDLNLQYCKKVKSFGNIKYIGGYILLLNSNITEEYMKENYPHFLKKCIW